MKLTLILINNWGGIQYYYLKTKDKMTAYIYIDRIMMYMYTKYIQMHILKYKLINARSHDN